MGTEMEKVDILGGGQGNGSELVCERKEGWEGVERGGGDICMIGNEGLINIYGQGSWHGLLSPNKITQTSFFPSLLGVGFS